MVVKKYRWLFLVLVSLLISCAPGVTPPEVVEVFGGGGGNVPQPSQSQSGAVAPTETCGQMAASVSAQFAGCYNPENWGEIPGLSGGRCFTSSDCKCCFLVVPHEEPPVEEEAPTSLPTPTATPQQQEVGEKPPAGGGGRVLVVSRRIAVLITGIGFLLLALGSIFLEREVVQKDLWWPLAEVLGAIVYGFVLGQLWLSQVTLPTLNLGWEVKALLVSALAGLGVFWSVSEQASSRQNTIGYFLLVLSGLLAWLMWGGFLPLVVR